MGIFDHGKTWRFRVAADAGACISAFETGLTQQSSFKLTKTSWSVRRGTSSAGLPMAIATYEGRAGIAGAVTSLSESGDAEQQRALGSQITFEVEQVTESSTECAMWLNRGSRTLGFQNDGRFFRAAMNTVERRIRELDPSFIVEKS